MVRKKTRPNPSPVISGKKRLKSDSEDETKQKQKSSKTNESTRKKNAKTMQVLVQHHPKVQNMTRKMYKDIRSLQMNTKNLIPALPFQRLVREIMQQYCPNELMRVQTEALRALQEAAEMYVTQYFEDAYFCCIHAKRKTLYVSDMQCVRRLRGRTDIINH